VLTDRAVTRSAIGLLVLALAGAAYESRATLDDRGLPVGALAVLVPLGLAVVAGLAGRWGRALWIAEGVGVVTVVAFGWSYAMETQNTPDCRTCGTCCEGAAMILFLGIPVLFVLVTLGVPLVSGVVRGIAALIRRLAEAVHHPG
jgi:hypothetical protein